MLERAGSIPCTSLEMHCNDMQISRDVIMHAAEWGRRISADKATKPHLERFGPCKRAPADSGEVTGHGYEDTYSVQSVNPHQWHFFTKYLRFQGNGSISDLLHQAHTLLPGTSSKPKQQDMSS